MSDRPAAATAEFPARFTALVEAFAMLNTFCAGNAIGTSDALRLKLVVEELFTNTIRHGYRTETDSTIRIALRAEPEAIALVYEDEAPGFDPTQRFILPSPESPAQVDGPVGGLGLRLLGAIVHQPTYVREGGCNRIRLCVPRTTTPG